MRGLLKIRVELHADRFFGGLLHVSYQPPHPAPVLWKTHLSARIGVRLTAFNCPLVVHLDAFLQGAEVAVYVSNTSATVCDTIEDLVASLHAVRSPRSDPNGEFGLWSHSNLFAAERHMNNKGTQRTQTRLNKQSKTKKQMSEQTSGTIGIADAL